MSIPVEDHKIIVEKARREAYHSGYKQGRFDEFIEAQYGRGDYDIVPVIRCKDCKHYYEKKLVVYTTCWYQSIVNAQPNDFCSRAERREE